jgi:hypothetical protein
VGGASHVAGMGEVRRTREVLRSGLQQLEGDNAKTQGLAGMNPPVP